MIKPKPGIPTTELFGTDLPIIADLGDGWFLVAHPNGAAIANNNSMAALSYPSAETPIAVPSNIPETVRAAAVEAFEKLAWPLVRDQFYEPGVSVDSKSVQKRKAAQSLTRPTPEVKP